MYSQFFVSHLIRFNIYVPQPRLYDSAFANTVGPPLPLPTADPDMSTFMRSSPPLRSPPPPPQVDDNPHEDSKDSLESDPPAGSVRGVGTTDARSTSDDDDGSTEYYTDQPPDSPLERSPSPTQVHLLAKNHSYEGHSGHGEGSSQSSQSVQRLKDPSSDEDEDGQTPRGKSKRGRKGDTVPKSLEKGSDEELDGLRSEFSSQIAPFTPPRKLKPDPYATWSPTKRTIMVLVRSKTPGEEVNVKRALGEGITKLEMR